MRVRNKVIITVLIAVVILIAVPVVLSYSNYQQYKVNNDHITEFAGRLDEVIQEKDAFEMTELAPFEWDRMYMFHAYTPRESMEQAVQIKWHTNESYVGYLMDQSSLGDYPLSDDSLHKLVFVKEDKVVLDVTLNRYEIDFTSSRPITERSHSRYVVDRTVENTIMARNVES